MRNEDFRRFLDMESEYKLFDIIDSFGLPVWDFLRVNIVLRYLRSMNISTPASKSNPYKRLINICRSIPHSFLFSSKKKYFFAYSPVFYDNRGLMYDRIAEDLIDYLPAESYLLYNINIDYLKSKHKHYSPFPFDVYYHLKFKSLKLNDSHFERIKNALFDTFSVEVKKEDLDYDYRHYVIQYKVARKILSYTKPAKLFSSADMQKGFYLAARYLGIPSYEIQHGSMAYAYTSYSYPSSIKWGSNVGFADYFVMNGEGWCEANNLPVKQKYILGNNSFLIKNDNVSNDGYILVISTAMHSSVIREFTKDILGKLDTDIIYKLHPTEYSERSSYISYFEPFPKLRVAEINSNLTDLLAHSSLVVLLDSTVYFEAKTLGKRVAIIRHKDSEYLSEFIASSDNSCYVSSVIDIINALKMPIRLEGRRFYIPFDINVAKELLS